MSNTANPPTERNYDGTGAKEKSKLTYIEVNAKDACLERDGKQFPSFAGYLEDFAVFWENEPKHADIPPHWKYRLTISARDETDGEVKNFGISLSGHWRNRIIGDALNQLAGAMLTPGWDRFVKISIFPKANGDKRPTTCCKLRGRTDQPLPTKFAFDEALKGFVGVPKPLELANGQVDFQNVNDFFKGIGDEIAAHFKHAPATKDSQAPPPPQAPATQAAAATAGEITLVQRAINYTTNALAGAPATRENLPPILAVAVASLKKNKATVKDESEFLAYVNKNYPFPDGWFDGSGNFQKNITNTNLDDLPF